MQNVRMTTLLSRARVSSDGGVLESGETHRDGEPSSRALQPIIRGPPDPQFT
jgi:hypothetical protein